MAWEYHVYLVDPALDYVPIEHVFYGLTKGECLERFRGHQDVCKSFGPAVAEGRYDDKWREVDRRDLPTVETSDGEEAIEMEPE